MVSWNFTLPPLHLIENPIPLLILHHPILILGELSQLLILYPTKLLLI